MEDEWHGVGMSNGHSKLAPSAAHRWYSCTASVAFVESLNLPSEDSPYAQEGTIAHITFSEALALDNPFAVAYRTPEEAEYLPRAIEYVETIRALHPEAPLYREIKVDPAKFVRTRHCRGTADVIIPVDLGPLYVADLKFGVHYAVDVIDNLQLLLYALGALAKFEDEGYTFTEIVFAILQPRAYHPDGAIREQRVSYEELVAWGRKIGARAREALSGGGVFRPDPEGACRFCPAQGVCRALASTELSKARDVFSDNIVADDGVSYKDIEALTVGELGSLLKEFPGIRRWMSEASSYALRFLEHGGAIPYWGLKDKRANRAWGASDDLDMYFDEDVLYERKLRSPAQVEKLAGKGSVDAFVERPITGKTIVATDEALDNPDKIASVFGELPMT